MSEHPRRRRRVLRAIGAVAAVLVGVGVLVARSILSGGGETREIPVEEVIRRYQESMSTPLLPVTAPATSAGATPLISTSSVVAAGAAPVTSTSSVAAAASPTSAAAAPAPLAEPGVYLYDTTGYDSIDVMAGVQHDYPAVTTITIVPGACGVVQRWDVVAERGEEWTRCAVGGGAIETARMNHDEFFDIDQTDHYECTGEPRPLDVGGAASWTSTCRLAGRDVVRTGTVIGTEPLTIGGTVVSSLHARVTIDNGRESDRQVTDSWYRVGTDLLLAQTASNHTTNNTAFGVVHYIEEYEIRLTSLVPVA